MKKPTLLFALFSSLSCLSAFAALPTSIVCSNERGLKIEMTLTPYEAVVPIYKVVEKYKGKVIKTLEAALTLNTKTRFQVMTSDDEESDNLIYAGYEYSSGEAYIQTVANNGLSPLPATFFKECEIE